VIHRLPILMVASYRGEEAPWMAGALVNAARVHLAPFEKADIASLARSIVGRRGDTPRIVDFLEHHTEGNAFFIVETLRALAEQAGELSRVGEGPLPEHIVAAGVESLVAYRIALAPEKFRPMLEYAVLLGREPDLKVLESLLGRETVYDGLTACMHSLLLEVRSGTWRFSHDKFRETLLRQIGPERAPALHQAVAEAITKIYPDSEDHYVALAYHFSMAGDTVQETRYATLAGRTAIRQGGYKSALALLSRALELLRAQPEPDETAILPRVARLGKDMKHFDGPVKEIKIIDKNGNLFTEKDNDKRFFEASWMHKYKGKYYFSYSTGDTHFINYAIGDNPYGPFTYQGVVLNPVDGWTNHHSIIEVNNKWYLFYHDVQLSGKTHLRNVKVTELKYNDDGSIQPITAYK